ncbi:hypothetical protein U5801_23190 [Lamprobacter modestohalophilus]|uniref:hypothetical protein n=1 Tax=Lamprobacter modestohalophilus TaxID=1064514 RepID=UPI002ADEDDE6|nr:hypothetical protein [Lamprobacter modestohalophilus]MEA1052692.1 hypothetical protein [Lamprobacter modestohalophilus]
MEGLVFADGNLPGGHAGGQRLALFGGDVDHRLLERGIQRLLAAVGGAHKGR